MNKQREAMKLALQALEEISAANPDDWEFDICADAKNLLREALAEPEQEAAPDLLEALENLADYIDERAGDNECRPLENARAALAKAKGEV